MKSSSLLTERRLWVATSIYSFFILIVVASYTFVTTSKFSIRLLNNSIADVAIVLIGLSLILSSVCYFWNFADKYIIYRKHFGLVGTGYMLLHVCISFFYSEYSPFPFYYLEKSRIYSFIPALIATAIFVLLSLISNRFSIRSIGPSRWRKIMKIGYIGFFLVLIHFGIKRSQYWISWLTGNSDILFPSFSLIAFVFGITVISLRIALWISILKKNKKK